MYKNTIKLNVSVNIQELRDYYSIIKTNYKHLKWVATEQQKNIKEESWKNANLILEKAPSGYAINSYLLDGDDRIPPPWNLISSDFTDGRKRTEMCFGIAERILDKIPMAYRLGITIATSGQYGHSHTDDDWSIHIPIYSPPKSFWIWYDSERNPIAYEHYDDDGSMWALNTLEMHGFENQDTEERVHMFFRVKKEDISELLKIEGII